MTVRVDWRWTSRRCAAPIDAVYLLPRRRGLPRGFFWRGANSEGIGTPPRDKLRASSSRVMSVPVSLGEGWANGGARCAVPMFLSRIEPADQVDHDQRTFKCLAGDYSETVTDKLR